MGAWTVEQMRTLSCSVETEDTTSEPQRTK